VQQHGRLDVALPAAPPFFRFSDADESKRVLAEAGFADPQAVEVDQTWHLAPPETPFHGLLRGGVRMGALLRAQEPSALARIEKEVKARAAAYLRDGQLLVPMPCMLASAIKR
jgi:hypothetical protein